MKKIYFTTEIGELGSIILVSTMRDILDYESSFEKELQKIFGKYDVCETAENIYEITNGIRYLTEDELLEVEEILLGLGWEKGEWWDNEE